MRHCRLPSLEMQSKPRRNDQKRTGGLTCVKNAFSHSITFYEVQRRERGRERRKNAQLTIDHNTNQVFRWDCRRAIFPLDIPVSPIAAAHAAGEG